MSSLSALHGRILIAGDETKSANAIARLLESAGYNTTITTSLQSARERIDSLEASLVVIDLTASRVTGALHQPAGDDSGHSLRRLDWAQEALSLCRHIRSNQTTAELPVLVLSKSQRPQDKIACLDAGATEYLMKPYQRAELLSRVSSHLRSWHIERERTARFEQLNLVHSVSTVLASSLEPEFLVKETLSILSNYLHASSALAYHGSNQSMSVVASEGFEVTEELRSSLLDFYFMTAPLMNGSPLLVEPLPENARAGLDPAVLRNARGLICAPLGLQGNPVGAVCLFSNETQPFRKQDADLLATICNQLSVALENARLFVETKKSAAHLSFVYNLGNNLMNSLEMEELLTYAVFSVGKSLSCDSCAVIVSGSGDGVNLVGAVYAPAVGDKASTHWYHQDRVRAYLKAEQNVGQPSIEVRINQRFLKDPFVAMETIVPIVFDDKLLGMLVCASYSERPFSNDHEKLLGAVAQQLSLAIRNTELYRETKNTSINLAVEVAYRTQEIEEQKRFTEKIIDSLPVSLYVVDRDMRIVAWNRSREVGGLGASREEVLGKNVFGVLARQPRRILEEEFTQVFRSGEMARMEQESWYEGQRKVWKISKIPMRVDNAEVTHVITVGEDVTEQKKMNEAVIHAEKLASIGRLAAGVVHEINNPLATIAACAEALSARVDEMQNRQVNDDFSEYLQIIRDEAFRCKSITNSLLEFSHQRQAEKTSADINQIIDQTLLLIKHHPKLGKSRIVKELDYSLTSVYVNEGQMKQVFIALISNAYDAMGVDGTLTIRTRPASPGSVPRVCAEFCDTGSGIPASHLPKIFDPFFTTKPLGRGTGLGLSVCYGIVSEHGGTIEVESVENEGSTFRVMLPVTESQSKPIRADGREESADTESPAHEPLLEMEGAL